MASGYHIFGKSTASKWVLTHSRQLRVVSIVSGLIDVGKPKGIAFSYLVGDTDF